MLGRASRGTAALLLVLAASPALAATPRPRRAVRTPALPSVIVPPDASERDLVVGEACRRALGSTGGAAVAMDPVTGRVITVVNPRSALFKAYTPCSVFKTVVAIAGLTEGVITPSSVYNCQKGCSMWPGHGPIDLRRALAASCNPYFEWVGESLGYEKIRKYAQLLGLGEPSGINLTGETAGRVPEFVRPELVGHLSSHAAGIETSAIQLAVLVSAIVNGGIVFQPQVGGAAGFAPHERWRLPEGTRLDGLAEGFLSAVNEGTATGSFDPDVVVAGKTGTCANLGWFASYAPADRPSLVLVVFLRGGSGPQASGVAGRIFQEIFRPVAASVTAAGGS
jgi:penicillin-binding protein 2